MPPPSVLWDESAALTQLAAFVRACCPEVPAADVYRSRPAATPGKFGVSILLFPLTPVPEYGSPWGSESDAAQRQRWSVTVTAAAAGAWTVTLLGVTTAPYAAGPGDSPQDIADALRAAVDALALPVTTAALPAPPVASFEVLGDVAGASLGVSVSAPAGGAAALAVVDDNVRRATYNFGVWRVRVIFRDQVSSQAAPASGHRYLSAILAERFRLWLQASSLPATNGLAYPYRRDQLQAAPARLSWRSTGDPLSLDEVDGQVWSRAVALDVEFETPVAMTYDVPSLDAIGLLDLSLADG